MYIAKLWIKSWLKCGALLLEYSLYITGDLELMGGVAKADLGTGKEEEFDLV